MPRSFCDQTNTVARTCSVAPADGAFSCVVGPILACQQAIGSAIPVEFPGADQAAYFWLQKLRGISQDWLPHKQSNQDRRVFQGSRDRSLTVAALIVALADGGWF